MKLSCLLAAVLLAAALGPPGRAEEPRSASLLRWSALRADPPAAHDAAAAARLDAAMRAAGGSEAPLKRWRGMYAVQLGLPQREVLACLDTGAPRNAVSGAAAREAGLGDGESAWLRTRVRLGGAELGPFTLRVEDSPARMRRPALLGLPTLQAFGAVLDSARGRLFVSPRRPGALSAALAADRTRRVIPLQRAGERDRLYVSAVVNGVRGFLLLDTGVANTTLHRSAGVRTGIAWQSRPDQVSIDYRGREHPVHRGRPASFTLGGVPVPPVTFVRRDQPLLEYVAHDAPASWGVFFGLLGNDVLERLEAVVDCAGERLYVPKK